MPPQRPWYGGQPPRR